MVPIIAALIVVISLTLILTERLDHTIGAMVGATAMMIAGRSSSRPGAPGQRAPVRDTPGRQRR